MVRSLRRAAASLALSLAALPAGPGSAEVGGVPLPAQAVPARMPRRLHDKYLAAMAAHQVDPALFAPDVRFTENGVQLPFGNEGLWATASGARQLQVLRARRRDPAGRLPRHGDGAASSSADGPGAPPEPVGRRCACGSSHGRISRNRADRRPARPAARAGGRAEQQPVPGHRRSGRGDGRAASDFLQAVPEKPSGWSRADLIAVANQYFDAACSATTARATIRSPTTACGTRTA